MTRRRKHGILSAMLAASLALTSMTTALAAAPVPTDDEAIALLQSYGIVKGDQFGNLNLEKPITRAEAATIFVRALGQESTAALLGDLVPFTDAKGHWAAGYITVAYRLDVMKGRSNTIFDPDALITNQEVYTVLLRLVQREPLGTWNPTQIMQVSQELGLTPANVDLNLLGPAQALRGTIFRSMGKAVSSLTLADGKTVLASYGVDREAPSLVLDPLPSSASGNSIRLTGTSQGAAYLQVGNQQFKVNTGRFAIDVPLSGGENDLTVTAVDWAGNTTSQNISITRAGAAATLVVVGEVAVKAGQTVPLQAIAYDAAGIALPSSAVTATVSNNLGTYNAAGGTFTAGNTAGAGTITFKAGTVTKEVALSVLGLSPQAVGLRIKDADQVVTTVGKVGTVTVEILDADGNPVIYDDGRTVSLSATGLTGLSVLNATAVTSKGVATFSVSGSRMGVATLTAASNGLGTATGTLNVASSTRILLSTVAANANADGSTPVIIRASLVNEKGEAVANTTGSDIRVEIETDSTTTVPSSNILIIGRGKYTSEGTDAALTPGLITETVGVTGKVLSTGHNFSVVGTSINLTEVKIGAPVKLELVTLSPVRSPGQLTTFSVRVVDSNGNLVPTNSYGFQVTATTTNGETTLPATADVTVGGYTVEKGVTGSFVGRTKAGMATITLSYPKSGRVTLKVVGVAATDEAVDNDGEIGTTLNSTNLQAGEAIATYSTTADHIELAWDVAGQTDQDTAVLLGNGTATAKLKVYVYDAYGGRIPTISGTARIVDSDGTADINGAVSRAGAAAVSVTEGSGEFTITSKSTTTDGTDTWRVTFTPNTGAALPAVTTTLRVVKEKLAKPTIIEMSGGESGLPNRVLASDTYMSLSFNGYAGSWGTVKVVRSNGTAVWTSPIIDLSLGYVNVPKNELVVGSERYGIIVNNGAGDSVRSDFWPNDTAARVVVEQSVKVDVTGARYDAATGRLIVTTNTSLTGGVVNPIYIAVENTTTDYMVYLSGATCTTSSSTLTCTGIDLDPELFYGRVRVVVEDGWWAKDASGQTAVAEENVDNNWVYPSAYLDGLTVSYTYSSGNIAGAKITLTGTNLDKGRLVLSKLKIGAVALGSTTINSTGSGTATFNVSKAIAEAIAALPGSSTLTAEQGWLVSSSGDQNGALGGIALFADVKITAITYDAGSNTVTVRGSGFEDATEADIDPSLFIVKERVGSGVWNLSGTVTIVDDTTITIALGANPAWEAGNSGKLLFGTEAGWLVTLNGWAAQGITPMFRPTW